MWRIPVSLALLALGVTGVYQLMTLDIHFLLFALFGGVCGAAAGWAFSDRRGLLAGFALGFLGTLAYLSLWFAFNLPPYVGINL